MFEDSLRGKADLSDRGDILLYDLQQLTRPRGILQNSASPIIEQLLLRRNELETLAKYAKEIYSLRLCLRELSLRDNYLTKLPIELLPLSQLTSISLASNRLESIDEDILPRFSHLQWLALSGNHLSDLPNDLFKCVELKGLDIHNNCFTAIPHCVANLPNLEILLVHQNRINNVPRNFTFCSKLQTLNISFNLLHEIPAALIQCPPPGLAHLYLSGNPLRQIAPLFLQFGYSELVSLDLHTCQIDSLPPTFFVRLSTSKLRRLNLAINTLTSIPEEMGLLKSLEWLNLNDNRLICLPTSLSNLTRLVKLGLVQNRLETLPEHLFSRMYKLQKLDIRRNRLRYFPSSLLAMVPLSEAASNVDVAAPLTTFHMSACPPSCPIQTRESSLCGGSLRTLLCADNPGILHQEGVIFKGVPSETADLLLLNGDHIMTAIRRFNNLESPDDLLNAIAYIRYQAQQQNQQVTKMGDTALDDIDNDNTERLTSPELSQVPALREISIRVLLNKGCGKFLRVASLDTYGECATCLEHIPVHQPHLAIYPEHRQRYLETFLPYSIPDTLRQMILISSRQCDYCRQWFSDSRLQIAYIARVCMHRHLVPIRFGVCSPECAFRSILQLQKYKDQWVGASQSALESENGNVFDGSASVAMQTPPLVPVSAEENEHRKFTDIVRQCLSRIALFLTASLISSRQDESLGTPARNSRLRSLIPVQDPPSANAGHSRSLRLGSAVPTTAGFNFLPRDVIRLEKF